MDAIQLVLGHSFHRNTVKRARSQPAMGLAIGEIGTVEYIFTLKYVGN